MDTAIHPWLWHATTSFRSDATRQVGHLVPLLRTKSTASLTSRWGIHNYSFANVDAQSFASPELSPLCLRPNAFREHELPSFLVVNLSSKLRRWI